MVFPQLTHGAVCIRAGELQILDVRERSEWDTEHIPGSTHTPYHDIDAIAEWKWERAGHPVERSG